MGVVVPDGDKEVGAGRGMGAMDNVGGREPPVGVGSGILQVGVPGGVPP